MTPQPKQPEQEPDLGGVDVFYPQRPDEIGTGCECPNCANGMGMCHTEEAQPEQEPVAITITGKLGNIYSFTSDYSLKKGDKVYATPPQRKPMTDAEEVLQALDSCEWNLVRIPPSSWLTDEANQQMAWGVSRTLPPFCSPDGTRMWKGATAIEALENGKAAIEAAHGIKEKDMTPQPAPAPVRWPFPTHQPEPRCPTHEPVLFPSHMG